MVPFFVLTISFSLLCLLRTNSRIKSLYSVVDAACVSMALMLIITGTAHFNSMRSDLIRMVPPVFPRPDLLVTLTGILEYLGAIGIVWRRARRLASISISLLFLALLPANIYAALNGLELGGSPVTPLELRIPMQAVFVAFALSPFWSRLIGSSR